MKKTLLISVLLTVLLAASGSSLAQGNLIVNGSFEADGGSLDGWMNLTATYGYTTIADVQNGIGIPPVNPNPPDGSHIAEFLQGGGILSQTILTTPNFYYALSFSEIAFQGTNAASVSVNGSLLATLNFTNTLPINFIYGPYNTNWQGFSFIFQASSIVTTILFTFRTSGRSAGSWC
jgi:hypothetical protein